LQECLIFARPVFAQVIANFLSEIMRIVGGERKKKTYDYDIMS
jgi:hypothetical protein